VLVEPVGVVQVAVSKLLLDLAVGLVLGKLGWAVLLLVFLLELVVVHAKCVDDFCLGLLVDGLLDSFDFVLQELTGLIG
jgi:hypothetical protein